MQSLLDEFNINLKSIEDYISHIGLVNNLVENNKNIQSEALILFEKHMKEFHVAKKIFEYKSIIISIYGLMENTISLLIQKHVSNIPRIVNYYSDLEEKFKDRHFNLSIKLISTIIEGKYAKYENIDKEIILKNLFDLQSNMSDYILNSEAYIPSSGNLKHSKILEAFQSLDIDLSSVLNSEKSFIDELVSRRNEIAHGGKIDQILNIMMFPEYINSVNQCIEKISNSIIKKESDYQLKNELKYSYTTIEIIHCIHNNSILCFQLNNNSIKVGDNLIIEDANRNIFKRNIIDIQVNNKSINNIETTNIIDIGVNLGNDGQNIKDNQCFYIQKRIL